jgi:hypothetical protein
MIGQILESKREFLPLCRIIAIWEGGIQMINFKLHRGDLIKDQFGTYYFVIGQAQKQLILANAVLSLSFARILTEEYFDEHKREFVGQYPTQQLKNHIEKIQNGETQFNIYLLEMLLNDGYEVVVEQYFDKKPGITVDVK